MQTDALRKLGADWVRSNCAHGRMEREFLSAFDRALRLGGESAFCFGKRVTKRRKPYLVRFHAGQMFVFELNRTQEKNLRSRADGMFWAPRSPPDHLGPATTLAIEINNLAIDARNRLVMGEPIAGQCTYSLGSYSLAAGDPGPCSLNLYCEQLGGIEMSAWFRPVAPLAATGTIEFTFLTPERGVVSPGHGDSALPVGTMLGFVRFCRPPDHRGFADVTLSNTYGVLLDFVG